MGSLSPVLLVGAAVLGLGSILHTVGLGTNYWYDSNKPQTMYHSGLFKGCNIVQCLEITKITAELEVVRALIIIGMLFTFLAAGFAAVLVFLKIIKQSVPDLLNFVPVAAGIAAFVLIVIGVIVYASEVVTDDFGYSFYLCIVGAILQLVGGMLATVGARKE